MKGGSREQGPASQRTDPPHPRHHLNEKKTQYKQGHSSTALVARLMAQMLLGHACPWPAESDLRYACATPQSRPTRRSASPLKSGLPCATCERNTAQQHKGHFALQPARHARGPADTGSPCPGSQRPQRLPGRLLQSQPAILCDGVPELSRPATQLTPRSARWWAAAG